MAGIEALAPPMSSDPNARMWTQIRGLQARVASLESRRDLIYRASQTNYAPSGSDSFTFNAAGRSLLVMLGPNRLLLPTFTGGAPRIGRVRIDIDFPTPLGLETIATSFDTNANGAFQSTNVITTVVDGVDPGEYTATVSASGGSELRYFVLILELPT